MELEFSTRSRSDSQAQLVRSSRSSLHKIKPIPVTVSGISVASTVWLIATFLLIIGLAVAAGFPFWMTLDSPPTYLAARNIKIGLFYFCYTPGTPGADSTESGSEECSLYVYPKFEPSSLSNLATIEAIDVVYLLTASILYGFGVGLLMISTIVGIVAYCKPRIKEHSVFLVAFVLQLFACIFLLAGLVLFPLSFHSGFMRQFCGTSADYYVRGKCAVDWSTQVAMVLVSLTFYLPPFAIFSMNVSDGLRAYNCC